MARVPGARGKMGPSLGMFALSGGITPETMTLWLIVALELLAHVGLRRYFRRHHGG